MNISTFATFALAFSLSIACTSAYAAKPRAEVVSVSEVKWTPLNPLRGDKGPQAGTLWGDRAGPAPTGFLVKFLDGFSSPPHIHNVTYRGVVISGLVHNDDPQAAKMWMPAGSFWTQPAGEVHITAATGANNVAFIEIDRGPYLVRPPNEATDVGERPINMVPSNIVWVDPAGVPKSADGPKVAYLWGKPDDGELSGTFVRLPAGFSGKISSNGATFRAVVIEGQPTHKGAEVKTLAPGSYFGSTGEWVHDVSSEAGESIIYIRTDGRYEVVPDDAQL
ncbi:MAG: DUF4437 domain-containing protein [Pseudomonadota bacterium]